MALFCNITDLNFLYWNSPAFVASANGNGQPKGMIVQNYASAVATCCSDAPTINYSYQAFSSESAMLGSSTLQKSIALPVAFINVLSATQPQNFLPLVDLDTFIMLAPQLSNTNSNIGTTLQSLWPLFLVFIGMTLVIAYLTWFTETFIGKEISTFPRSYSLGMFDAFWFSYITASSVGYGDKIAHTIVGKILTMLWITVSWVLLAVVMGTFNSLYNFVGSQAIAMPTLAGSQVGVLANSIERDMVTLAGGVPIDQPTIATLMNNLVSGAIDAALLDPFEFYDEFGYADNVWTEYGIRSQLISGRHSVTIGFLFRNSYTVTSPALFSCLQESSFLTRIKNRQTQNSILMNFTKGYDRATAALYASQLFTPGEVLFSIVLPSGALVIVVLTQLLLCAMRRKTSSKLSANESNAAASSLPSSSLALTVNYVQSTPNHSGNGIGNGNGV